MSDFDLARSALACIPYQDRDQWVKIGMALKGSLGDAGLPLFEEFTERSSDSRKKDLRSSWRSFKAGGRVTLGTLVHEAKEHGFVLGQSGLSRSTWDELQAARVAQKRRVEQERLDREKAAELASLSASERWDAAKKDGASPYLVKKQVTGEAIRYEAHDNGFLVPMIRYDLPRDSALVGLQTILPDGSKLYGKGVGKEGSAVRLGPAMLGHEAPIAIAEGYATARSIRMATDGRWTVFVAFDAGNLLPVAKIVRKLYPENWVLFAADDDYQTVGNPGRTKAMVAARRIKNADVGAPVFEAREGRKLTDWNDLHCTEGLAEVSRQLIRIIENVKRYGQRRIAA
jgi:putative DNA primase/helicase